MESSVERYSGKEYGILVFNTLKKNWFYDDSELVKKILSFSWDYSLPGKEKIDRKNNIDSAIQEIMLVFAISKGDPEIFYPTLIAHLEYIKVKERIFTWSFAGEKCLWITDVDQDLVAKKFTIRHKKNFGAKVEGPIFVNCDGDSIFAFNYSEGKWTNFHPDKNFLYAVDPDVRALFTKKGFDEHRGLFWTRNGYE